ncbi:MAG: low specificity L-threonine aldolase [Verrucomicrobiaceae bacterium]|nr:low specificity L-threonine aldolase [Verrucomicrobiaceae bacterium]
MNFTFASDNTSAICPDAWQALEAANSGCEPSYGDDALTRGACEAFRRFFDAECEVFFVFSGTAANALSLASICAGHHSIIAAEESHCEQDECGAPAFFTHGARILIAGGQHGKLDPGEVSRLIARRTDVHFHKPRAISISNSTELGTVYRPDEIKPLADLAHAHGLALHVDGARFFNALASRSCTPADLTWRAGVDVLSCGGTKLGMAFTEAVVFFNRDLAADFAWRRKQAGQLCSKMRFISAQWLRILTTDAWRRHAENGNTLARELAEGLGRLPGVEILQPVDANAVFARLPDRMKSGLKQRGWKFYGFIGGGSRLMCSWQTTKQDVEAFVADARASL